MLGRISCNLAMENLTQDGELSTAETNRKKKFYKMPSFCLLVSNVQKILKDSSDYDLSKFVEG